MSKSASRARLAEIIRKRSFGRGEITLASGRKSDFYFNLKPTMLAYGRLMAAHLVGRIQPPPISPLGNEHLAGRSEQRPVAQLHAVAEKR